MKREESLERDPRNHKKSSCTYACSNAAQIGRSATFKPGHRSVRTFPRSGVARGLKLKGLPASRSCSYVEVIGIIPIALPPWTSKLSGIAGGVLASGCCGGVFGAIAGSSSGCFGVLPVGVGGCCGVLSLALIAAERNWSALSAGPPSTI